MELAKHSIGDASLETQLRNQKPEINISRLSRQMQIHLESEANPLATEGLVKFVCHIVFSKIENKWNNDILPVVNGIEPFLQKNLYWQSK